MKKNLISLFLLVICSPLALAMEDYYKILGVPRNANKREIKKAFSDLSKKHHPDKSNDQENLSFYTEIVNAYETLKDPEKKREYDEKLLYTENDYSDILFRRNQGYQYKYRQRYYDDPGDFSSFGSFGNRRFHRSQTVDIGQVLFDYFKERLDELYNFFFETIPFVLEIVYQGISVIIVFGLFLMNFLISSVHKFLKT